MRSILLLSLCCLLLFSCTQKTVTVVVDKTVAQGEMQQIVFDGKDSFNLRDTAIHIQLTPGKHQFSINKSAPRDFEVSIAGGLLNPDNKEYIAYSVRYEAEKTPRSLSDIPGFSAHRNTLNAIVLIDSFVIVAKPNLAQSDSSLRKILPALQQAKNGNYLGFGKPVKNYDTDEMVAGIKKFGKDQLFINQFWDYGINEKIPETLEVQTEQQYSSKASATRKAIMPASLFLMYAGLSKDDYVVKTLEDIRLGNNDRESPLPEESTSTDKIREKRKAQVK